MPLTVLSGDDRGGETRVANALWVKLFTTGARVF